MEKPLYRDMYEILKKIERNNISWFIIEDIFEEKKWKTIYDWLIKKWYIKTIEDNIMKLKKEFEDKVIYDKTLEGMFTKDWKEIPIEWLYEDKDLVISLTLDWKLFLENYSKFLKRINYQLEDYHIVMPLILWFILWIISSLLINLFKIF